MAIVVGSQAARMSEHDDSLPRLLGGRYRLEAKLGSGGMGVVYRATDQTMHRPVAVKLIRGVDGLALDEEVAGRFLREAKNTARVQHENIIEVYDLGRSDQGDMYFVMELLEGESLSAKMRREGKLATDVAVHIARQMCAALHVAHSAGIIHRDLKPANIMLVHRGNDPNYVKVLDFGVAKSYTPDQQTQLTHTGMLVGTVEYMAPEQIMGRTVDGRTDLYALGVVMYRMLTGKPPFRDGGVPAMIHAHLNLYPKPMAEMQAEVSGELDRVILRCLAKQPQQRYESMEELSRALAAATEPAAPEGIVNLDYDDDIYDASDKTQVARGPSPTRPTSAPPRPTPAAGRSVPPPRSVPPARSVERALENDDSFDDATIKMDRPDPDADPRIPRLGSLEDSSDRTKVMIREEMSPEKRRPVPDSVTRVESTGPRECAMCKTLNAPHASACVACGVSLASEDQEAVRARVTAPRPLHPPMQQQHVPYHAQPQQQPPQQQQFAHAPMLGMQGMPGMQPMPGPHGPPLMQPQQPQQPFPNVSWHAPTPAQVPQSPSVWQRFLTWTGLRGS